MRAYNRQVSGCYHRWCQCDHVVCLGPMSIVKFPMNLPETVLGLWHCLC